MLLNITTFLQFEARICLFQTSCRLRLVFTSKLGTICKGSTSYLLRPMEDV